MDKISAEFEIAEKVAEYFSQRKFEAENLANSSKSWKTPYFLNFSAEIF
jgi:hypothetical protein